VCLSPEGRVAAQAAFPSGDLPEAPDGEKAVLSRFAMARANYFPPPTERAALHREAK
jgi:hypothetical protein